MSLYLQTKGAVAVSLRLLPRHSLSGRSGWKGKSAMHRSVQNAVPAHLTEVMELRYQNEVGRAIAS